MNCKNLLATMLLCSLLLTTCSRGTPSAASDISSTISSVSEEKEENKLKIATFKQSANEFISNIKSYADKEDPSLLNADPIITENDASESLPAHVSYEYKIYNSASLVLYEEKSSSELYSIFYTYDVFAETDEHSQKLGYLTGLLLSIEPDRTVAEQIIEDLNLTNVMSSNTTITTGTNAEWTYIVESDPENFSSRSMLNIMAK